MKEMIKDCNLKKNIIYIHVHCEFTFILVTFKHRKRNGNGMRNLRLKLAEPWLVTSRQRTRPN